VLSHSPVGPFITQAIPGVQGIPATMSASKILFDSKHGLSRRMDISIPCFLRDTPARRMYHGPPHCPRPAKLSIFPPANSSLRSPANLVSPCSHNILLRSCTLFTAISKENKVGMLFFRPGLSKIVSVGAWVLSPKIAAVERRTPHCAHSNPPPARGKYPKIWFSRNPSRSARFGVTSVTVTRDGHGERWV
jgi:hypothetical protein